MLRPERMSRVSVTGSRRVMTDVVEAVHDLSLFDVTDYDGAWDGFTPGNPVEGADSASEKLVTVRALESILGVDPDDDGGPTRIVTDEALEDELEDVRTRVNELDDRRGDVEDELASIEEQLDQVEPLVDLGIDLDLLSGYDTLTVVVGHGDQEALRRSLTEADGVQNYQLFSGEDTVAAFVYPADAPVEDVLVGTTLEQVQIPDAEGNPTEYESRLRDRKRELAAELEDVEDDIADLRREVGGFLLAAEEKLTIEVQKREAPLSFATTENAFVAEGWLPSDRYLDLAEALQDEVGDHVEVEELERADYDHHGSAAVREPADEHAGATAGEVAADGGDGLRADGGHATTTDRPMSGGEPPVTQENPEIVSPFELLVKAVGRPKYTEIDPTVVLFLTFPVMFGFMIGDVGYGIIYTAIGYYVYANFDSQAFKSFGGITISAGLMTILFGVLYGELFGLHLVTQYLWEPIIGHPPIEKGLSPATVEWAQAWFVITALFGILHLNVGYVFEFVEGLSLHGMKEAVLESGSWLLALNGLWLFIFSTLYADTKPSLLFDVFNHGEGAAFELGFAGLPVWVGWGGVVMLAAGFVLLIIGPTHEVIEFHQVLAHVLSYLRIGAVLLAKAGMAFAVNLLFFGAYTEHGEFHFMLSHGPEYVLEHTPEATIMFPGLVHGGVAAVVGGVVILLVGHLVVLLLGVTSAGIQAVRLEYFEFFSKFYEGGGTPYSPFGYERTFTTEE